MHWRAIFPNGLDVYLGDPGQVPGIGPERGKKKFEGIAKFTSPFGSHRYVLYRNGSAIAALQVVSRSRQLATIANVYVVPEARRQGAATKLLRRAEKDFDVVEHASVSMRSSDAAAWIEGIK